MTGRSPAAAADAPADQPLSLLPEELLDASPDAIVVIDRDGTVVYVNGAVTGLFGYRPDELVGRPMEVLVPESLRSSHAAHRLRYAHRPARRAMGAGLHLLGRRRDGSEFPIDVGLAPIQGGERFAAFVRDATAWTKVQQRLQAVNQLTEAVLAGGTIDELLGATARGARALVNAQVAAVVDLDPEPDPADRVRVTDSSPDDDWSSPEVLIGAARTPEAIGNGRVLAVALSGGNLRQQMLVALRRPDVVPFEPLDSELLTDYATAVDVTLRLGQTRRELEQLAIIGEHGRIARDLHDTVIQRLFATGMSIQSVLVLLGGVARDRVAEAVEELDSTIGEIRTTIFGLEHASADPDQLRSRVLTLTTELTEPLGFRPRVAFDGPVDTLVDRELTSELLKVLREALSNVARHAEASRAEVVVSVAGGELVLAVSDDGVGPPDGPSAGHGLRNLTERADAHGGTCRLTARRPSGSRLEWRVPLPSR